MRKVFLLFGLSCTSLVFAQKTDYPIQPVKFTDVHLSDDFWKPKMEVNAKTTIPYILTRLRTEGRIDNFLAAAGLRENKVCSEYPFDDTDVYKWIEGASYALQNNPDPSLSKSIDSLITVIENAQEPDGYLFTFRTIHPVQMHPWLGSKRWLKDEDLSHELYNAGHLYEAAYAHYNATGKRSLLYVVLRNADLLVNTFGWDKLRIYPGHQIVELGLVKLYRITGQRKYLDLAKFFLDVRGPGGNEYNQAAKRVTDQTEAVGHAVRAAYMYSGMADIAAITGDKDYLRAIDAIWNDVVSHKLYVTGGIGATNNGEAFGKAYELPNMSAYAETCAAIANVYWNNRMFLLHGDSKYIDVLERTLYNGLLSGVSLDGTRFFYPNPLASVGQHERSGWFSCACCISNMTRFLPSVSGYVYAKDGDNLYVNLFVSNNADVDLRSGRVSVTQTTSYPWNGAVQLTINPLSNTRLSLRIRIPGWSKGVPIPGDLYRSNWQAAPLVINVNGKPFGYTIQNGYAVLDRKWKKDDKISFDFSMKPFAVFANQKVKDDNGKFAVQNGPIVYALEGVDNKDQSVRNIIADTVVLMNVSFRPDVLNGVNVISLKGAGTKRQLNSDLLLRSEQEVKAIPYYAWNNRGAGEMEVWIPYNPQVSHPTPAPTIANTSKVSASIKTRSLFAVSDQYDPIDSKDASSPYFHWWPRKDQTEWVIYEFDKPHKVSSSAVYWFDDGPWGGCRIPNSRKIYYRSENNDWIPVQNISDYPIAKDSYNKVIFTPVTTSALKLEVRLPKDNSSGVHEWKVD